MENVLSFNNSIYPFIVSFMNNSGTIDYYTDSLRCSYDIFSNNRHIIKNIHLLSNSKKSRELISFIGLYNEIGIKAQKAYIYATKMKCGDISEEKLLNEFRTIVEFITCKNMKYPNGRIALLQSKCLEICNLFDIPVEIYNYDL